MDFDFSDEQKMLRDQTRRFLADRDATAQARKGLENGAAMDEGAWQGLTAMGLAGAAVPEALGGAGLGPLENCVVMEELGRALAATPMASTLGALAALEAADGPDADAARKAWMPKLASGEAVAVVAMGEGIGPFLPDALATRLEGGVVRGDKVPVPDLMVADVAIVAARGGALALVALDAQGVSREAVETLDPTRPQGHLRLEGVKAQTLATHGAALDKAMNVMAAQAAFEALGVADTALTMAKAYALERYAFGRPIGSFQAIKHRLADMFILNELARSNCYRVAMALESDATDLPEAAAGAFVSAAEAAIFAAQENVQVHGGVGYTWESDCQIPYRRARGISLRLGGVAAWKERLVRALERANAAQ